MKKKVLALLLCLAQPSWATYALISHGASQTSGSCTGAAVTVTLSTLGADLIVIGIVNNDGAVAPTDDQGNTYTSAQVASQWSGSAIYYKQAPNTAGTHVFTLSNTNRCSAMAVSAWSGSTSSPKDQSTSNASNCSGTTCQPGSVTPTTSNQLIITTLVVDPTAITNPPTDGTYTYTALDTKNFNPSVAYAMAMAYTIVSGAGSATNPTWSFSNSQGGTASTIIVTFQASAGGATPLAPQRLLQGVGL